MINDYSTGADFGRATASWFGLDVDKVSDVQLQTDLNEPLSATITILLSPDDVTGIGKRMKEMAAGSNGIVSVDMAKNPVDMPSPGPGRSWTWTR